MTRVAVALKKARLKNNLTQEKVSISLGLARPVYVSHVESGKNPPSPRILKGLCEIYNLDFNKTLKLYMRDYQDVFMAKLDK
jgi:transcriptional regulator with XRE-family HTH domain